MGVEVVEAGINSRMWSFALLIEGQKSEAGSGRSLIQASPGPKRPGFDALFKLVRIDSQLFHA